MNKMYKNKLTKVISSFFYAKLTWVMQLSFKTQIHT